MRVRAMKAKTMISPVAGQVYAQFLATVINTGVFSAEERAADIPVPSEAQARAVAGGKKIDARTPRLMRLSGKGGYVEGDGFAARRIFRNVTLLDHVASVTRGALVLAEIDLRGAGVEDEAVLKPRLAVIAATAFLHDADKMLGLSRLEEIEISAIDTLVARYKIDDFLASHNVVMSGADLLPRIHNVESSRYGSLKPGWALLSTEDVKDCAYVRLADRLDGVFLQTQPDARARTRTAGHGGSAYAAGAYAAGAYAAGAYGIDGVVAEIDRFEDLRSDALRAGWRALRLNAPHTPFLLDALQGGFAAAVKDLTGVPPLVEVHYDGELLLVAPEAVFDRALDRGIERMGRQLGSGLRVEVNLRGARDILDGGIAASDLNNFLREESDIAAKALFLHRDTITTHKSDIEADFDSLGFGVSFPDFDKIGDTKHLVCWPVRSDDSGARTETRALAAAVAVAIACPAPKEKALAGRTPNSAIRERELRALLAEHGCDAPAWIVEASHYLSRWTLLGAWAAANADSDPDLEQSLKEILAVWLEGDESRAGIFAKIGDPGAALAAAAAKWVMAAARRTFISGDETLPGRCHFTGLPAGPKDVINTKTGLYGLNVSAFSGREGRPEHHDKTIAKTLVSMPAMAEHRLRSLENPKGAFGDVPAYISSPTSSGLFASLAAGGDEHITRFGIFDMARLEIKPTARTFVDSENFSSRVAIGRYDSLPTRLIKTGTTPGLISVAKMVIDTARRTGRPTHVYRGLPTPNNAFVVLEFLPSVLLEALGGYEFRLEQLDAASQMLRTIEAIAEADGLGLDLALAFANPSTRLAAACLAIVAISRQAPDKQERLSGLRMTLNNEARRHFVNPNPNDSAVIDFARAMTRIQIAPKREASNREAEFGLRIAIAAIEGAHRATQTSRESLLFAVAGEMQIEFQRGRVAWRGKDKGQAFPSRAALAAAEVFVDKLWNGAFRGVSPAAKARRTAFAIYRVAFETASYEKRTPQADGADNLHSEKPRIGDQSEDDLAAFAAE